MPNLPPDDRHSPSTMFQLLHQYLIENSRLHMPGIGTLEFAEIPARLEVVDNLLIAPRKVLRLNQDDYAFDKRGLLDYLSGRLEISEDQALSVYQQYIESLRTSLSTRRILYWLNLGAFQKDEAGVVQFVQTTDLDTYLPPVAAEKLLRGASPNPATADDMDSSSIILQQPVDDEEIKIDYWWVWAIVILVASTVMIWAKYL